MKMIDVPSSRLSCRRTAKISRVSWGVRTAVGSSRTRIVALRYSALRISTRCCQPTDSEPTFASGSTSKPNWLPRWRMRVCASLRSRKIGLAIGSSPRRMFSATDRTGTSMKCWCTMLMPRSIASDGLRIVTGSPSIRISPSSGSARPYRMFIRVDLPAPFSPSRAWISSGPHLQVDVVVGDHSRIALRHAAHLERGDVSRRDGAVGHRTPVNAAGSAGWSKGGPEWTRPSVLLVLRPI